MVSLASITLSVKLPEPFVSRSLTKQKQLAKLEFAPRMVKHRLIMTTLLSTKLLLSKAERKKLKWL